MKHLQSLQVDKHPGYLASTSTYNSLKDFYTARDQASWVVSYASVALPVFFILGISQNISLTISPLPRLHFKCKCVSLANVFLLQLLSCLTYISRSDTSRLSRPHPLLFACFPYTCSLTSSTARPQNNVQHMLSLLCHNLLDQR